MSQNKKGKENILLIILIITGLALIISASFALMQKTFVGPNINRIKSGKITFIYTEPQTSLNVYESELKENSEAIIDNNYFDLKIEAQATGKTKISYIIYFTPVSNNTIPSSYINMALTSVSSENDAIANERLIINKKANLFTPFSTSTLSYSSGSNNFLIYQKTLDFTTNNSKQIDYYRFRMWIDKSYSDTLLNETTTVHEISIPNNTTYKVKINVYGFNGNAKDITNS